MVYVGSEMYEAGADDITFDATAAPGDLVARMQLNGSMKIDSAKKHVADKLKISVADIADPVVVNELREDQDIGRVNEALGVAKGIDAKFRIGRLLGVDINKGGSLFKANGFEVLDLGRDISNEKIIEEAVRFEADIIGTSVLLTTTMLHSTSWKKN